MIMNSQKIKYLERKTDKKSETISKEMPSAQKIDDILQNGFIILDKPCGPTSMECVAHIKTILGLDKAGQSGTLDPETSGVLLVATENACKIMPLLQGMEKEYVAVMHIHKDISDLQLQAVVKKFVGAIRQIPPVKSAVKRRERTRFVNEIQILDRKDKDVCLRVVCEAGTYIRKMIDDMGKEIGGAHMKELRRIRVGSFTEQEAHTLQELRNAFDDYKESKNEKIREIVMPIEYALRNAKIVIIKESAVGNVKNGSPVYSAGVLRVRSDICEKDTIAIVSSNGVLIALGTALSNAFEIVRKKCVAAKVDRVM